MRRLINSSRWMKPVNDGDRKIALRRN